jgi:hypothetical protein
MEVSESGLTIMDQLGLYDTACLVPGSRAEVEFKAMYESLGHDEIMQFEAVSVDEMTERAV